MADNSRDNSQQPPDQANNNGLSQSSFETDSGSSSRHTKDRLQDKQKGRVRFETASPSTKSHFLRLHSPAGIHFKKGPSPLSSPPIVRDASPEEDYFSAGHSSSSASASKTSTSSSSSRGSQVGLVDNPNQKIVADANTLSNIRNMQQTVTFDESPGNGAVPSRNSMISSPTEPRPAVTHGFSLESLMDVGSHGGMAPFAIDSSGGSSAMGSTTVLNDYKRKSLVGFGQSSSAPGSRSSSPLLEGGAYGDDASEKDIPLMDLSDKEVTYENLDALARKLIHVHTVNRNNNDFVVPLMDTDWSEYHYGEGSGTPRDGAATPQYEDYVAPPTHVRQGILGSLLKLYSEAEAEASRPGSAGPIPRSPSPTTSGELKEKPSLKSFHSSDSGVKWYKHKHSRSSSSVASLLMTASSTLTAPGSSEVPKSLKPKVPHPGRGGILPAKHKNKMKRLADQIRITVHIADVLQRQRFILKMCKALMLYGAPTHRLEEYLQMTARVLELDAQFVYIPGCMIVSFADTTTHTSEVQVLRVTQGLNLVKMRNIHQIYKEVVHDILGVEEASSRIDELLAIKNLYPNWLRIIFFGLASAMVTPFAFSGRWLDMPIAFVLGSIVGILQIWVAPRSNLYSNVFEVASAIIVSFIGRAVGSMGRNQDIFCFSAIVQGSLALILPGYLILTGALELQSRNIVAGSVRMFYAVIYFLFLIFGITLGAAIYGLIDRNATSATTCANSLNPLYRILFVPAFAAFIAMVNQAHVQQLPAQVLIASIGYTVSYFVNLRAGASEITSSLGAFAIGIAGNIYSRVGHGLAFAAMLPGIFVIVPSGVAIQGSLVSGITNADQLITNSTQNGTSQLSQSAQSSQSSSSVLSVGFTVIQLSVGITVGLFIATLVVYPLGKKRSGLLTF